MKRLIALVAVAFLACGSDVVSSTSDSLSMQATRNPTTAETANFNPSQLQLANHFELAGGSLEILYSASTDPTLSKLQYRNGDQRAYFHGSDITTLATPAGTMVSVTIRRTVDMGYTALSLLIPRVRVGAGSNAPVDTVAVITNHLPAIGPALTTGQLDAYTFTPLQGTGACVESGPVGIVPKL
jgi:hypothetical protein